MNEAPRLAEVLRAIATGSAVDWNAVDATPADESTSSLIEELKVLGRIAEVHGNARRDADAGGDDDEPLSSWGPLTILERVGRGSYGDVYRAWDTRLDREVALKLLRRRTATDGSPVIEEGRLLARVRHPNAITVHGADCVDGRTGIWMEFIEGRTLEEELQARGPLPAEEVAALGIDICRALDAVHKAGVVHRDIKAQNVMREATGRTVLMDFGSGLRAESGDAVVGGTPLYLAPELLAGEPATIRSDVYAVGVLLYHLLTGRYPVEGSTLADVRAQHRDSPPVPLRRTRPDVPKRLCAAIERAVAFDPWERYESAAAFEAALSIAMRQRIWKLTATYPVPALEPPGMPRLSKRRGTRVAAVVATVALATLMSFALWQWRPAADPPLAFQPRDLVLVTSFVNRTNERELDGVLEYAIERELANSTHVSVAPRARVEDALRLMKKPADARVDAGIGREVCQRDGGIPALITGRTEKVGPSYVVSAEVVACSDGGLAATVTEEARDADALTGAIRRLANSLRGRLGEGRAAIQNSLQQLERVTTPSLRALRLYSESFQLGYRQQWPGALELARQAVAADETFASAQVWLAWAMRNNGLPREAWLPVADKAVALSTAVTDWERQWILGSYFGMTGDDERAEAAYQALAQLRPDHFWGIGNLFQLYRRQNRIEKALPYVTKLADLRPHDPISNLRAAQRILDVTHDFVRARPYISRLLQDPTEGPPYAWAVFVDAAERLGRRDSPGVVSEAVRHLETLDKHPGVAARDAVVAKAIRYLLAVGRGRDAQRAIERFGDKTFYQPFYRAIVAFTTGDASVARSSIKNVPFNDYSNVAASLMARLGMIREAETFLNSWPPPTAEWRDFMLYGTVAAARGDLNASIPVLERMAARRNPGNHARTQADLASVWLRRGGQERAIDALRESWERDPHLDVDIDGPYGHDWMPNALLLAELYRRAGRKADAAPIEADLTRLLSIADPDFPLLLRLKHLDAIRP